MFGPVRRMERRRGLVVGMAIGAAAARPRTAVVYGAPAYGCCSTTYYAPPSQVVVATPPPPTQVIINQSEKIPAPPASYPPPPASYPPAQAAAYQQAPPPPYQQQAPAYQQAPPYQQQNQQAYNPAYPPNIPAETVKAPVPAVERPAERRYFIIVNEANCQVLQADHGSSHKGSRVVIDKRRSDRVNLQRWYLDREGVIRCAVNDYALESKDGGDKLYTAPYNGLSHQQWIFMDNKIVNKVQTCDCIGLKKWLLLSDDADVIVTRYDNKPYQHWRREYLAV